MKGTHPSKTSLFGSGSTGNYMLLATARGLANKAGLAGPSGSIALLDTSSGNQSLGSASLGTGLEAFSLTGLTNFSTGMFPELVGLADFKGDGIIDLATATSKF